MNRDPSPILKPTVYFLALWVGVAVLDVFLATSLDFQPGMRNLGPCGVIATLIIATIAAILAFRPEYAEIVRRRRVEQGRCGKCAYNLRGNSSGICPECGTTVEPRW